MAVTYVGTGNTTGTGTGGTSQTCTLPAGIAVNDIALVTYAVHDTTSVISFDSRFSTAASLVTADGQVILRWRRITQSDIDAGAGGQPSIGRSNITGACVMNCSAYRGVRTSGLPWDVAPTIRGNPSGTAVAADGLTVPQANNLVVMLAAWWLDLSSTAQASGWSTANLGALTETLDNTNASANGAGLGHANVAMPTAGDTGAGSATLATASPNVGMLVALTGSAPIAPPTGPKVPSVGARVGVRQPGVYSVGGRG